MAVVFKKKFVLPTSVSVNPIAAPTPFRLPRFYPIVDTAAHGSAGLNPVILSEALVEAGVRILQFRHKDPWHQEHLDDARRISRLCAEAGVLFVLNDRADYARLLGAALHIGQDDLPPLAARAVIGDEVVGLSTHNSEQLAAAAGEQVEYLSLGPVFATNSKLNPDPVLGLDGLRRSRSLTEKPICGIGGITLLNARSVIAAGADSVAVISGLLPDSAAEHNRRGLRDRAAQWLAVLAG